MKDFLEFSVLYKLKGGDHLSNGAAYADLDLDGDLDLVVNNINEIASVYRNYSREKTGNHFLQLKLTAAKFNTMAIGAEVTLELKDKKLTQQVMTSRGFQSSVEPILTFGLGKDSVVEKIHITWPDGSYSVHENIAIDTRMEIEQGESNIKDSQPAETYFSEVKTSFPSHLENNYNDFNQQPLLHHFLSTEGPAIAVGDVNGDGKEDIFSGGAKGYTAQILLQNRDGEFGEGDESVFVEDQEAEDVDAVFFDADGDKDLLLGGNLYGTRVKFGRYDANHGVVLLGDGSGNFSALSPIKSGLNVKGETRAIRMLNKDSANPRLIFGRSNLPLKMYHVRPIP